MARLCSWDINGVSYEWFDLDNTLNGWWDRDLVPGTRTQILAPSGVASDESVGGMSASTISTLSGVASDECVGSITVQAGPTPPPPRNVFRGGGGSGGTQKQYDIYTLFPLDDQAEREYDEWIWSLFDPFVKDDLFVVTPPGSYTDPQPSVTGDPNVIIVEKDVPRWKTTPQDTVVVVSPGTETIRQVKMSKMKLAIAASIILAIGVTIGVQMTKADTAATRHQTKSAKTAKAARKAPKSPRTK